MTTDWIAKIAEERKRQQQQEGWSLEHDDEHTDGSLADAAACYAATQPVYRKAVDGLYFWDLWPWESMYDGRKRHDEKRRLVIAAALIVAELERLDRVEVVDAG